MVGNADDKYDVKELSEVHGKTSVQICWSLFTNTNLSAGDVNLAAAGGFFLGGSGSAGVSAAAPALSDRSASSASSDGPNQDPIFRRMRLPICRTEPVESSSFLEKGGRYMSHRNPKTPAIKIITTTLTTSMQQHPHPLRRGGGPKYCPEYGLWPDPERLLLFRRLELRLLEPEAPDLEAPNKSALLLWYIVWSLNTREGKS